MDHERGVEHDFARTEVHRNLFLAVECSRTFLHDKFTFYHPHMIGDFLICVCATTLKPPVSTQSFDFCAQTTANPEKTAKDNSSSQTPDYSRMYLVSIYENGEIVDVAMDSRFRSSKWAKQHKIFGGFLNSSELQALFEDLHAAVADTRRRLLAAWKKSY